MSIAYIDSTQNTAGFTNQITINKPTGVSEGDLLLAVVGWENNQTPASWTSVPSGWTEIVDRQECGGSPTRPCTFSVWYKVAGASEPSSYTWQASISGVGLMGVISAYSGVDETTPMDATRTVATGGAATTVDPPSITTVTNDAFVIAIGFRQDDTGYDSMSSGYDEREEVTNVMFGDGATLGVCDDEIASAGAEDPGTFANTGSDSEEWGAVTVALRPAGGAAVIDNAAIMGAMF